MGKGFLGTLLITISLALVSVLLLPQYDKISAFQTAIAERKIQLIEREALVQRVKELSQESKEKITDAQKLSAVVPTAKSPAELISALQAIADSTGVRMDEIGLRDGATPKADQQGSIDISMKIAGGYTSTKAFLDAIEKNARLMDIFSLELGTDLTNPALVNTTISVVAYFVK